MDKNSTDRLLEEQYLKEADFMEQTLLKMNGIDPLQAPETESQEKIDREYARMIAHLKSQGEYREEKQEVIGPKELGWREPSILEWLYTRFFPAATAILIGCMVGMLSMIELGRYFV